MKMFSKLTFEEVREGHFQAKQQFGKHQLSVVLLPGATLYDNDDVIPGLTPGAVDAIMYKLALLEIAQ